MPVTLNGAGKAQAARLIRGGKVNEDSAWAFSAEDGNKLLGDPPDWSAYSKWFLGRDTGEDRESKAAWKYPYGKDDKVYVSALRAIISRAGQQGATDIQEAARTLLADAQPEKGAVTPNRIRLLSRQDWERGVRNNERDIGIIKLGHVDVTKGPTDPVTGMRDIDTVISTEDVDRDRDIIYQDGWDLSAYAKNPVILWAHEHDQLPVGRSVTIGLDDRNRLVSRDRFTPADVYPFGHTVYRMVEGGFLSAKSVGFRPIEWTVDEERRGYDLYRCELLEHSWVPVPANPSALVGASAAGIDLTLLKEWAERVLDHDPDLPWLPRDVVERAWKDLRLVGGTAAARSSTGRNLHVFLDDEGGDDTDRIVAAGGEPLDAVKHQPEADMELAEFGKLVTSLTDQVKALVERQDKILAALEAEREEANSIELSDLVRGVVKDVMAERAGKLPD